MKQQRRNHSQRGDALISLLIAFAIMGVMLAAIAPALVRKTQNDNADSAASWAAGINAAEFQYQNYGGYVPPQSLGGTFALPKACNNPMLVSGQIANQLPAGYASTFNPGVVIATFSCPSGPTVAYLGYQLSLDPSNRLQASRHFFSCTGSSCSNPANNGLIKFADGRPAIENDSTYAILAPSIQNGGGSSGNNGTGTNVWGGTWANGSYSTGIIVLAPTTYNGSTGSAGPYLSITSNGGANYPPSDPTDWLFLGGGAPNYTPAPPPTPPCSSGVSGSLPTFVVPNSSGNGNGTTGNLMLNACGTFHNFNVNFQTGSVSNSTIGFQFNDSNAGAYISCNVYLGNGPSSGNFFSCSGPSQGGAGGTMTLNPGDNTFISYSSAENNNPPSISIQNFSWSLNP
jgi:type II secretory pathway pseudopilin PulG